MFNSNHVRTFQILLLGAVLSACGSSSSDSGPATSDVAIRFSDAPVDDLEKVVITVDKLIFNQAGDDIIVDTFTSDELGLTDSETFKIDLLQVKGNDNLLVLDSVKLPVGDYQNLRVVVLDEDIEDTYVDEVGGSESKALKIPSNELKLGGFSVGNTSSQTFVVEFGLRQAMTYNPGPDRYILKPRGVRIVRLEDASTISGNVDISTASCTPSADTSLSHVAYLYEGHDLDAASLADVFVRESDLTDFDGVPVDGTDFDGSVPDNVIAPHVATSIDENGDYLFSYLNAGNYTVAISCNAVADSSIIYDEITVPSPAGQIVELVLEKETDIECDFVEGLEPYDESCTEKLPL